MKKIIVGFYAIILSLGMMHCTDPMNLRDFNPKSNKGGDQNQTTASFTLAGETAYSDAGTGIMSGTIGDCPAYGEYVYTLYAGQTNVAGEVTISTDGSNLYVTYNTNGSADLQEAHVYLWTDMSEIPDKRPSPGQAPYTAENINADSYTFTIALADIACGNTYYVSTHAALIADGTDGDDEDDGTTANNEGETAYSGGSNTPDGITSDKGAWWSYVTYNIECFYDISGVVYDDANNSFDNESEATFSGITVTLMDANGVVSTTSTDSDGAYIFENLPAGNEYTVIVDSGPDGYAPTENADGYMTGALNDCLTEIDFGFYMPEDDDDDDDDDDDGTGGDGTGALSYVSFDTGCSETISNFSNTNSDFTYNVEIDYKQTTGTVKFEATGDQLGEDGASETDTYVFTASCEASEITVETKNRDTETVVFQAGEERDMGNGFTVTWNSVTQNADGTFTYTFTIVSDNIGGGGN